MPTHQLPQEDLYLHRLWKAAESLARRQSRACPHDAQDVASRIVTKVLPRLAEYRTNYESPEVLASVMIGHSTIDYRRNQSAQRGEGARLVPAQIAVQHSAGGFHWSDFDKTAHQSGSQLLRPARVVESLNVDTFVESQNATTEASFVLILEATEITRELITKLRDVHNVSHRDLCLLIKVDAYGQKVTEAAKDLHLRRETAQRILGRVRNLARSVAEGVETRNGAEPVGPAPSS